MNRRHFLSGSLAVIAAASLPKAKRRQTNLPYTYKTILVPNKADQTYYQLSIYHNAVHKLATATETEKTIVVVVKHYGTTDLTKPTTSGEFRYIIKSSTTKDGLWIVEAKLDKKLSGEYKFPKEFPKDLKLRVYLYAYAKILDKNEKELVNIPYPTSSTDDDEMDCFLTTACVHHKKLADDCFELNTLRDLRNNFILKSPGGRKLIEDYRTMGPALIQSINSCENKAEIYDYMYDQLILPSLALLQKGKKQDAVLYYKNFVEGLSAKYL